MKPVAVDSVLPNIGFKNVTGPEVNEVPVISFRPLLYPVLEETIVTVEFIPADNPTTEIEPVSLIITLPDPVADPVHI